MAVTPPTKIEEKDKPFDRLEGTITVNVPATSLENYKASWQYMFGYDARASFVGIE